ncbi:MAG TPA: MarR family transcriptional regulator [Anaerolineales bacterium]|nr:MarR family transcriptional regulator [Anaerolineales bacterium]
MSRGKQETARRSELIDQLKILSEVASTETALFHQEAAAALGLGITDMKTLSILLQEGPMTAGQISRRLSLTTGAVTNLIDRLEGRGLVERQRDQKDRRKVIVSVNEGNLQAGESPYVSIGKGFARQLATYSTAELEFLVSYHEQTIELTREEIAKLAKRAQGGSA